MQARENLLNALKQVHLDAACLANAHETTLITIGALTAYLDAFDHAESDSAKEMIVKMAVKTVEQAKERIEYFEDKRCEQSQNH